MPTATVPPCNSVAPRSGWSHRTSPRFHGGTFIGASWVWLIECWLAAPAYACGEEFHRGTKLANVCQSCSMRNVLLWFHGGTFVGVLTGLC